MVTMSWDQVFGQVTGKQNPHHKMGSKFSEWRVLEQDTWFNGQEYAKGSRWRAWEGRDFGFVAFAGDSKTPQGNVPNRFLHRF